MPDIQCRNCGAVRHVRGMHHRETGECPICGALGWMDAPTPTPSCLAPDRRDDELIRICRNVATAVGRDAEVRLALFDACGLAIETVASQRTKWVLATLLTELARG